MSEMEKVEMISKWLKDKQDAVPESAGDWFIFRDPQTAPAQMTMDGSTEEIQVQGEIRLTRAEVQGMMTTSDLTPGEIWINHNGTPLKLMSVVKISLGDAEKNAKGGE